MPQTLMILWAYGAVGVQVGVSRFYNYGIQQGFTQKTVTEIVDKMKK